MDITQLAQLPLVVLVILGAYWVIQRLNDEHAKRLIELFGQFSENYTVLIKRAEEERAEARLRWTERDRQLTDLILKNTEALTNNANQTHTLRSTLQPIVTWWELERRDNSSGRSTRTGGSRSNATE